MALTGKSTYFEPELSIESPLDSAISEDRKRWGRNNRLGFRGLRDSFPAPDESYTDPPTGSESAEAVIADTYSRPLASHGTISSDSPHNPIDKASQ